MAVKVHSRSEFLSNFLNLQRNQTTFLAVSRFTGLVVVNYRRKNVFASNLKLCGKFLFCYLEQQGRDLELNLVVKSINE